MRMNSTGFKDARQALCLTQERLGRKMGMSQRAISLIESNRSPTLLQTAFILVLIDQKEKDVMGER